MKVVSIALLFLPLTAIIPAGDLSLLLYRNPHADIGLVTPDGNANIIVHTAREAWPWNGAVLAVRLTRLFRSVSHRHGVDGLCAGAPPLAGQTSVCSAGHDLCCLQPHVYFYRWFSQQ